MTRPFALFLVLLTAVLPTTGCIRSKVLVTSEPPGAVVTMNGSNLGTTPTARPFAWYWFYDFEARKEGYETRSIRKRFSPPFYMMPGPDFILELLPVNIHDTKRVHFVLEPAQPRPDPLFIDKPIRATASAGNPTP